MNRFAAVFALLLLAAAPPPGGSPLPLQTTLANGLRVILLPDRLAPVATVAIVYGAGSNEDTLPGLAHATEHMMYRGTSDVTATQFADIANRMGAQYNASTGNEYTDFYFKIPSAYVGLALRLEADRMTGAAIREADWATERKAIEQEVRAHESVPGAKIDAKLGALFYGPGNLLARPTVGTIDGFEKMQASDIAAFYHAWYHPNDATVIVAGDIDPQAALAQVRGAFDAIPSAPLPPRAVVSLGPLVSSTLADTVDLPFPICALIFRAPSATAPEYASALVLNQVFNSRRGALAELGTSGKLLGALSLYSALPETGSSFLVGVPARAGSASDAAALLAQTLANYRTGGVPHDLVAAARFRLLSDQAYENASISGLAFRWVYAVGQRQESADAVYDAIAKVSDDDVDATLKTYYAPDHQLTALLSPSSFAPSAHVDPKAAVENVAYKPTQNEPLPAWASAALDVPLTVPASRSSDTIVHLANGLTVVVRRESVAPTAILRGEIVTSPELYEPAGREGVATLTTALLPYGTTAYDRVAYQAELDGIAASASLGDSFELEVGAKNFDRGVQLLADGMLHPAFSQSAFDVLKAQMVQAVGDADKLPAVRASAAESDALYPPGDPRRRRATAKSVAAIGLGDVRRWYAFAFRPDLTTIAVVGDVEPAEAVATVRKYFGGWRAFGKMPTFRYPSIPERAAKSETITVKSPAATQSDVTLKQVFDLAKSDRDYVPLLLANTMLSGEGTGSLLFEEVRTHRGYVYNVSSNIDVERGRATFTVNYQSNPGDVDRAQASVVSVIERLRAAPLSAVDLQRAKALLIAERVLPLDSYAGVASDLLSTAQYGTTAAESDRFWKALVATTPAQVEAAMRAHVRPKHFLRVIVAPEN